MSLLWIVAMGVSAASPCGAAVPVRGTLRVIAVLAEFPDQRLSRPRSYFAGRPDALLDRLSTYYAEVSAGRLHVSVRLGRPVVTLSERRSRYVQRPGAMAAEALAAFGAAADPEERRALAETHAAVVFFAGTGRESHTQRAIPNDPWSNYVALAPPARAGPAVFEEAIVIAEREVEPFSVFGVLCHEFGHLLGLPELYAPGGRPQEGIGIWGLMGQGTWVGRGAWPTHPSAWEKMRLGWVDVETIERSTYAVELPAIGRVPRVVRISAVPGRPEEYYLLENRRRGGADRGIPGEGLLVWHVDERVAGFRSAQTEVGHKLLHLVEADGRGDLDRGHAAGGNRGDPSDPWTGPPAWHRRLGALLALLGALVAAGGVFRLVRPRPVRAVLVLGVVSAVLLGTAARLRRGPVCGPGTPGMAPYDGGAARVTIRNISPPGDPMRFDVLVRPGPAPPLG